MGGMVAEVSATCYYIDAVNGSDGNAGTSPALAWQTLTFASEKALGAGDSLLLKRGCQWKEGYGCYAAGSPKEPFLIGVYGTGAAPVINDTGDANGYGIELYDSWVVVESLLVKNSFNGGIFLTPYADSCIVRNCEITASGTGVEVGGRYNLVKGNYIHDMTMVLNEVGNTGDYGATGVLLENSCNEICYNRMIRCIAQCYVGDGGFDGGVVEFYGTPDSCLVHHNFALGCPKFTEVGGGSSINSRLYYNISINNGPLMCIHLNDQFASVVRNLQMDNNTILDTVTGDSTHYDLIDFIGTPTPGTFLFRNNIAFIKNFTYFTQATNADSGWLFTHTHNRYFLENSKIKLNMPLDSGETEGNPGFVDYADTNLHLQSNSPAISGGLSLGYTLDFYNNPVPTNPSLGAVQYATGPSITTPVVRPPALAGNETFEFSLKQSVIAYSLPKSEQVEVTLFDLLGRTALTINRIQAMGSYSIDLKNSALAEGRYIVRFKAGTFEKQELLLVKH